MDIKFILQRKSLGSLDFSFLVFRLWMLYLILRFYKNSHVYAWIAWLQVDSTEKITWIWRFLIFCLLLLMLILRFYKKSHIYAWQHGHQVNSTEKITWFFGFFVFSLCIFLPAIKKSDSTILQEITHIYQDILTQI